MQPNNFELHAESGITLICELPYFKKLSNYELSQTKTTMKTYANDSFSVTV